MRRSIVVLVCSMLAATGCGGGVAPGEAQTLRVRVDAAPRTGIGPLSNPTFRGSFLAFFPDSVQARPGDTVRFERFETGEPHSVTLGTIVDKAFADGKDGASLPEVVIADDGEIPQNLAQACFLDKGRPPKEPDRACSQASAAAAVAGATQVDETPPFDGTQTWYSSGFIRDDRPFDLQLGDDIEPGTYHFYCVFHGPNMSGTLEVVESGAAVQTQGEVNAAAAAQLEPLVEEGKAQLERERDRLEDADTAGLAGMILADGEVLINEFVPFTLEVSVDEPVSWQITGTHAISLDPPTGTAAPTIQQIGSAVEIDDDALNARRSPEPPGGPVDEPTTIEADPYEDGTHNSGLLRSPTGQLTYTISFSDFGTYRYVCLIHTGMRGLVTVSR